MMNEIINSSDLFLYGASGHAKVVIDIIEKTNKHQIRFLIDDNQHLKNSVLNGYLIAGGRDELLNAQSLEIGFVSIGDNRVRENVATWLVSLNYILATLVHPQACLAKGVKIGYGTVVMAGVVINSDSTVANNVIVNTKATIDHDCTIASGVHIAPGATLCGGVNIGKGAFIGAGAIVVPNVYIGENSMIAAGTVIYKNVPANTRIIGARNEW